MEAATNTPTPQHACPKCKSTDSLHEEVLVTGWRSIDSRLNPDGLSRDVDWGDVDHNGYGCTCGWSGGKSSLVKLGIDGEPLPEIHPDQQTLIA